MERNIQFNKSAYTHKDLEFVPDSPDYYYPNPELVEDVSLDILENRPVILTGHKGTGKSSLFKYLYNKKQMPLISVNLNGQMSVSDFVGYMAVEGNQTVWKRGVLEHCVREGYGLCLDEIDMAEPPVLAILNMISERGGKLFLKEKGFEPITPHPNFRLMGTSNTIGVMREFAYMYVGANPLNTALLDRYRVYEAKYLPPDVEATVLSDAIASRNKELKFENGGKKTEFDREIAEAIVNFANQLRTAFEQGETSETMSFRNLLDLAEMIMRKRQTMNIPPATPKEKRLAVIVQESLEKSYLSKLIAEDAKFVKELAGKYFNF